MVTQSNNIRESRTMSTAKHVERISGSKKDVKKKQATKQEHPKQQMHHKPHEFSLRSGELKDINYYLREDLDNSSDFDDYEIGPSIFPSKKKQTELEYSNKKKDTQELKKEAKKRAMKREIHDKKKTPQLKTEEGETASPHMSLSSFDHYDCNEYDMIDVDILNESLDQSTSSFSKLYLSNRSLSDNPPVVARTSSNEKMKKLFKGMKRRLSMNN
ncbi:predicted protein [Chaetoceros tenuissimus]|uniref:Uncharacterized protein n=1 Tax=Chaetoceros tenuissimus TaxID=426638 RepID=A0AAD3HB16_9STRA|nr:predicted protein [Chaetoceros tenuissimus]